MKTALAIIAAAAILQGCVTAEMKPAQNYVTTSMTVDSAKEVIIERFAQKGGYCEEGKNTLTCDNPLTMGQDILIRALVSGGGGSSKSTYGFTFISKGKTTHVYMRQWLTATNMYGSKMNSQSTPRKEDMAALQSLLNRSHHEKAVPKGQ